MAKPTVTFEPYAAAELRSVVQRMVDHYNVAATGQAEWYPVAFFLRDESGAVLGGLLGDIWAGWPRAERYARERGCTDAFLDAFSFQARAFYEKCGYRVFGILENHPAGHQHYFITKRL